MAIAPVRELMRSLAFGLLCAVAGALALWTFQPDPAPQYREVVVNVPQIVEVERVDTIVTWRERIVYRTVQAEQVATAPGGAASDVERFCGPDVQPSGDNSAPVEDPAPQPPVLLLRSMRLDDGWFFGKDRLILTGPLSNGDLRQLTYGTRGSVQAHVHGDTAIVQYPRSALFKTAAEGAVWALIGYLVGRL